jgi:hypothetical protein
LWTFARFSSWRAHGEPKEARIEQAWDITVGLAATVVAIVGLASSIATSNRGHLFGSVATSDQEALVAVAGIFGVVTGIKLWRANRGRRQ